MSKLILSITAAVVLAAPAAAKNKYDPRTQAMLACASITSNDARLRCYDQSLSGLKQALEKGEVVVRETSSPKALEGLVVATGRAGINRYWVQLDNGDRWQIISTSNFDDPPAKGVRVKLRKGVFGNYWFAEPNAQDRRALYMGRRS